MDDLKIGVPRTTTYPGEGAARVRRWRAEVWGVQGACVRTAPTSGVRRCGGAHALPSPVRGITSAAPMSPCRGLTAGENGCAPAGPKGLGLRDGAHIARPVAGRSRRSAHDDQRARRRERGGLGIHIRDEEIPEFDVTFLAGPVVRLPVVVHHVRPHEARRLHPRPPTRHDGIRAEGADLDRGDVQRAPSSPMPRNSTQLRAFR